MIRNLILYLSILLIPTACRERFEADGEFRNKNFLVVEGFINTSEGITQIRLSRVIALNQEHQLVTESNAVVTIEAHNGTTYNLHNRNNGTYESDPLNLAEDLEYRVRIEVDGKIYLSAYTEPVTTPPIDSVGWIADDHSNIIIHVNTHDAHNNTFYYKWEYEEVWEVRSTYASNWAYENGTPRSRTPDEVKLMSYCWPHRYNSDLIIGSTAQLTTDVISGFTLKTFPNSDQRLGWRYSINVSQRALTMEEYEFLQVMKKNTSDLGSFFDAQPSVLLGNIRCTSSDEPVVGYIGAYESRQERLIIKHSQISDFDYVAPCPFQQIDILFEDPLFSEYMTSTLPLEPIYGPFGDSDSAPIIGFSIVRNTCADCRIFAGIAPKPDFWVTEDQPPAD